MGGVAFTAAMGARPSTVVAWLLAAFVPYAWLFHREARCEGLPATLAWTAAAGAMLVVAPPVLSDDVYRYVWDGRVVLEGISPYAWAPDAPQLAFLRDAAWRHINHRSVPTVYPPLAQTLFAATQGGWPGARSLKLLALATHLLTTWLLGRYGGERGLGAARLYGLNPLALHEAALSGHVDAVAAFAVAACVLSWARRREGQAAGWAALASGVKLIGVVLTPLLGRRQARYGVLAALVSALALLPMLAVAQPTGLGHYVQRWRGNEAGFALLEGAARVAVDALAADGSPESRVHLEPLRPVLEALQDSPLDPRAAHRTEKKSAPDAASFARATLAALIARVWAGLGVLALLGWVWRRRVPPIRAARVVLLGVLLLAPQVHPWYLLWLLPVEALAGGIAGWVWSATVLVAYLPLERWQAFRAWEQPLAARLFEYGLVVGVLLWEARRVGNAPATPSSAWKPSHMAPRNG